MKNEPAVIDYDILGPVGFYDALCDLQYTAEVLMEGGAGISSETKEGMARVHKLLDMAREALLNEDNR